MFLNLTLCTKVRLEGLLLLKVLEDFHHAVTFSDCIPVQENKIFHTWPKYARVTI